MFSPLYLCGPTASGKSQLAIQLAKRLNGEIINLDPYQSYLGFPILTASPDEASQTSEIPHHLYQSIPLQTTLNAATYRELVLPIIRKIQNRRRIPILVGGSGLYLKFLTHGPAPLPQADPDIRAEIDHLTLPEIREKLTALDPIESARLPLPNRRHLTRALEICLLTGQPASTLRSNWEKESTRIESDLLGVYLDIPRPLLAERIATRTDEMLATGAIEEVKLAPPDISPTAQKTIGFHLIQQHLGGKLTRSELAEKITLATRQYAKRQQSWFKRETWLQKSTTSLPNSDLS